MLQKKNRKKEQESTELKKTTSIYNELFNFGNEKERKRRERKRKKKRKK